MIMERLIYLFLVAISRRFDVLGHSELLVLQEIEARLVLSVRFLQALQKLLLVSVQLIDLSLHPA